MSSRMRIATGRKLTVREAAEDDERVGRGAGETDVKGRQRGGRGGGMRFIVANRSCSSLVEEHS